jgi:hypothetical protein
MRPKSAVACVVRPVLKRATQPVGRRHSKRSVEDASVGSFGSTKDRAKRPCQVDQYGHPWRDWMFLNAAKPIEFFTSPVGRAFGSPEAIKTDGGTHASVKIESSAHVRAI